jgi:hypothetical protein
VREGEKKNKNKDHIICYFVPNTFLPTMSSFAETGIEFSVPSSALKSTGSVILSPVSEEDDVQLGEDKNPLGISIAHCTDHEAFVEFVELNDSKAYNRKFYRKDEQVYFKQVPATLVHNRTIQNISGQISIFNMNNTGFSIFPFVIDSDSAIRCGSGLSATPDVAIQVRDGLDFPVVIIEVFDSNGGLEAVKEQAETYLGPLSNVQMYIALNIMSPEDHAARSEFRACALVFMREHGAMPIDVISFGTIGMTRPEILQYLQTAMNTQLLRGERVDPRCSLERDYFIEIPWGIFTIQAGNEVIPWQEPIDSHNLLLSLASIQREIVSAFARMELPNKFTNS